MKVIDLLNKIANGEEVPKAFVYNDKLWRLASNGTYFIGNDYGYDFWLAHGDDKFEDEPIKLNELNDKVEIIEDKKELEVIEIPEKLNKNEFLHNKTIEQVDADLDFIIDTLNEIIDCLDYLKSKGE